MEKLLIVEGMKCEHCSKSVHDTLMNISGVKSVKVDLDSKEVLVEGENLDEKLMCLEIEDIGFDVKEIK